MPCVPIGKTMTAMATMLDEAADLLALTETCEDCPCCGWTGPGGVAPMHDAGCGLVAWLRKWRGEVDDAE